MRAYALRLASSGRFVKATLIFQAEEMSTFASPTIPSSQLTSDQLTVLVASFSSLVFFFVVIVLLSIIYRKDPQCCKHGSYQDPHADMGDNVHRSVLMNSYLPQLQGQHSKGLLDPPDTDAPPQYYSSRQTLVGSPCLEQTHIPEDSVTQLPGELFYVGLPSSYSLPALEATLPRLPSYESVRKKDRQRQIHMMIADRFGLNGPIVTESPPSYEESIRQSVELPCDILPSDLDVPLPQRAYMSVSPGYTTDSTILPPV